MFTKVMTQSPHCLQFFPSAFAVARTVHSDYGQLETVGTAPNSSSCPTLSSDCIQGWAWKQKNFCLEPSAAVISWL